MPSYNLALFLHDLVLFLDRWQTLIGSILALAAAVITVLMLRLQIDQAEKHEKYRRERRRNAIRAVLPVTLNRIIDYLNAATLALKSAVWRLEETNPFEKAQSYEPVIPASECPAFDKDVIDAIARTIEADDRHEVEKLLGRIAARLQVLSSRLASYNSFDPSLISIRDNLEDNLIDCAIIRAWVDALFPYARLQTETVRLDETEKDARNALRLMGLPPEPYSALYERLPAHVARREAGF